jgi:hypothetical protein
MMALITPYEVSRYIGLPETDLDEEVMEGLVSAAQAAIENITHRSLAAATGYTEYHNGGSESVFVKNPPIVNVTSVTDDAQYGARTVALTDVISTQDNGDNYAQGKIELWWNEGFFAGGRAQVKVVYRGGWDSTTIPADLKQAWIELVGFWYDVPDEDRAKPGYQAYVPPHLLTAFRKYSIDVFHATQGGKPMRGR